MIEFVYFDLGKVILEFSHQRACEQMAEVAGVPVERVREVLFDTELQNQYETGVVSSQEFFEQFCEATESTSNINELLRAGSDIFELNTAIVPVIAKLVSIGFPIGILSNTCEAHWDFVYRKYVILRDFFDRVILSYEVHSMKPDPGIYLAAIEQAGVDPGRILFMDDRNENVKGALEAGIQAVPFYSAQELTRQMIGFGLKLNL